MTDNYLVGQVTDKLMVLQDRVTRMLIGAGKREGEGLYRFQGVEIVTSLHTEACKDLVLCHNRMGHPCLQVTECIPGVRRSSSSNNELSIKNCDVCFRAKQTRQCFPDSLNNAKDNFDLIHCDLWGPYRTTAFCGSKYFLTIVDDHSRAVWLYLLADKAMAPMQIRNLITMIERQFSQKVKRIRSDNGTEFTCLTRYFQEQGIIHETSCVNTPQQNGRVERKHRHILNIARALRFQASLPIEYWGECVLTAAYLINRTPSVLLKNKTPFEVLFGHAPGYKHLKVLGCLAYAHNSHHKGDKFETRSRRCVFLGYPYGKKGWKLYDLERHVVFVSRDVAFQETIFPYAISDVAPVSNGDLGVPPTGENLDSDDEDETQIQINTEPVLDTSTSADTSQAPVADSLVPLGREHRQKQTSTRLKDYVVQTAVTLQPSSLSTTTPAPQPSSDTKYPIYNFVSCDRFYTETLGLCCGYVG